MWDSPSQQNQFFSHYILFAETELLAYGIGILHFKREKKTV